MVALLGLGERVKSDTFADTETGAAVMLFCEVTSTVPPLNCAAPPVDAGITTSVTVAVEPDCSELITQPAVVDVEVPVQVPAVAAMDCNPSGTLVISGRRSIVTLMLFARSGPLLVIV